MSLSTYFAVATCYISIFNCIFIVGYPSPTQKQLVLEGILNTDTLPIFASISHLSRIFGLFFVPILVQLNININIITVISQIFGGVGWLMVIMANTDYIIIIGVTIIGFHTGIGVIFINTYIGEVTLEDQRKVASGGIGFVIRIGVFVVYALGIWLSFRWLAFVGFLTLFLFTLFLVCNPISPVWLVANGLDERAKKVLTYLHGAKIDADSEIQNIKNKNINKDSCWKDSFKVFKSWKFLKPILLGSMVASFKELGGHEAMVSFASHILENQKEMDPKVASLFYPIFLIAGAIVSISIIKYCKLKWLLIIASTFMTFSHLSMSIYYFVSEKYLDCGADYSHLCHILTFWPIMNIAVYAFSFTLGWGLVYFAILGTVFVSHREISTAIVAFVENLSMFIIINLFYHLLKIVGGFWTFLCLALVNLTSIVFVYFFMKI